MREHRHEEPPELLASIEDALRQPHPLALLEQASGLVTLTDPRLQDPFHPGNRDGMPTFDELAGTFMDVDLPQTTALLHALAALTPDDLSRARIRRALAGRRHALPDWVGLLDHVDVRRAAMLTHVQGDGDDLLLDAVVSSGHAVTALVYVDHNMGTVVKDAFVIPAPLDEVLTTIRDRIDDPNSTVVDIDPADARTRLVEAIDGGARTYPPPESDTWPMCRPLVEWLVRTLPEGGRGWDRREWTDAERRQLVEEFFASTHAAGLDDPDRRSMADELVWYGTDYGNGDPLRWSPVRVEILLTDWIPRKIVADVDLLDTAPDLLRAFVRFAHERTGIRETLTAETLQSIDQYEPQYAELIRSDRPQGPAALLAQLGLLEGGDDEPADEFEDDDEESYARIMLEALAERVGGLGVLLTLDGGPLPDEPFDHEVVPRDVAERVDEVRGLADACCEELFDVETRTACRRLLADVMAGDARVFRRAGSASTAAAAVCWLVARANGQVGYDPAPLRVQDLMAHFGVKGSVSTRATTMLRAAGIPDQYGGTGLGSTRYLVSAHRHEIIGSRDRLLASRADELNG